MIRGLLPDLYLALFCISTSPSHLGGCLLCFPAATLRPTNTPASSLHLRLHPLDLPRLLLHCSHSSHPLHLHKTYIHHVFSLWFIHKCLEFALYVLTPHVCSPRVCQQKNKNIRLTSILWSSVDPSASPSTWNVCKIEQRGLFVSCWWFFFSNDFVCKRKWVSGLIYVENTD